MMISLDLVSDPQMRLVFFIVFGCCFIPIFALVDTNSDPRGIDYVIPANDDASKSIDKVLGYITDSIAEGLADRKVNKDAKDSDDNDNN